MRMRRLASARRLRRTWQISRTGRSSALRSRWPKPPFYKFEGTLALDSVPGTRRNSRRKRGTAVGGATEVNIALRRKQVATDQTPCDIDIAAGVYIHPSLLNRGSPGILRDIDWSGEAQSRIDGPAEENIVPRLCRVVFSPQDVDSSTRIHNDLRIKGATWAV